MIDRRNLLQISVASLASLGLATPARADGRFASGDVTIFYRSFGKPGKTPLILMHGADNFDSFDWIPVAEKLATDREVVCFDMRGFGESTWSPSKNYSYQRLLAPTHMRPIAHADGSYRVWRLCELFPCLACCFDNGVIMVEDAVGEPVGAHILPDVLHGVQLGRARGQEDWFYVRRHFELAGRMPPRPVHEQHSYRALGDMTRDFIEV